MVPRKKTPRKKTTRKPAAGRKVDLFRDRPEWFKAKTTPEIVKLGPAKYLTIEGSGAPEGPEFQKAIGALYAVAFTMKFAKKLGEGTDYKVSTLEALWWTGRKSAREASRKRFLTVPRKDWRWKLLNMVPDFIAAGDIKRAKTTLAARKGDPSVGRVRLETLREGSCVQILHVGPYAAEPDSIRRMDALARHEGLGLAGPHHEVYLGDPRRVKPERLKTILRQPVRRSPARSPSGR